MPTLQRSGLAVCDGESRQVKTNCISMVGPDGVPCAAQQSRESLRLLLRGSGPGGRTVAASGLFLRPAVCRAILR